MRGKELYHQLFTYQADWLAHIDEFGLTPDYVVSYTGQQIYAPHTKESPVKRAILKGNTLVNLFDKDTNDRVDSKTTVSVVGNEITITGTWFSSFKVNLKPSTKYTLFVEYLNGGRVVILDDYKNTNSSQSFNIQQQQAGTKGAHSFTTTATGSEYGILLYASGTGQTYKDVMIVEGDYTNTNIPYFEGMQSVKMPVLTTSNEDGTKSNILTVNEDVTLRSNGDVCDELDLLTGKLTQRIDENNEVLAQEVVKTVDLTIKDQNDFEVSQLSSFNGGTHFTTSSQDGSLLPSLSVDVVTDLEETLMVCSLEGNTM